MEETETKIKKKILGDINGHPSKRKIQSIRNLATAKKERTQKNSTIASKNPKTRFYGGSESNDFRVACGVTQTNIGYNHIGKH